ELVGRHRLAGRVAEVAAILALEHEAQHVHPQTPGRRAACPQGRVLHPVTGVELERGELLHGWVSRAGSAELGSPPPRSLTRPCRAGRSEGRARQTPVAANAPAGRASASSTPPESAGGRRRTPARRAAAGRGSPRPRRAGAGAETAPRGP